MKKWVPSTKWKCVPWSIIKCDPVIPEGWLLTKVQITFSVAYTKHRNLCKAGLQCPSAAEHKDQVRRGFYWILIWDWYVVWIPSFQHSNLQYGLNTDIFNHTVHFSSCLGIPSKCFGVVWTEFRIEFFISWNNALMTQQWRGPNGSSILGRE